MKEIRFKKQEKDQFIYLRRTIIAYPPEYLAVEEDREIIIQIIDNDHFEIKYNGAVKILEFDSTVSDFPTIKEIKAFCAGVDAGYDNIFDFIPEDLNGYTFEKILSEFEDHPTVLKTINDKGKLYRNAWGELECVSK